MRRVPYVDLAAQFAAERSEVMALVEEVFGAGEFVGGGAIAAFEEALAYITSHENVWVTTGQEIADWYYEHHYDTVLGALKSTRQSQG